MFCHGNNLVQFLRLRQQTLSAADRAIAILPIAFYMFHPLHKDATQSWGSNNLDSLIAFERCGEPLRGLFRVNKADLPCFQDSV